MSNSDEIPLFTSIQPNIKRFIQGEECGAEYQAFCIQSWLEAGFKVYSLNNASEIEILKPLHSDVTFLEVKSKIPKITEFFDAGRKLDVGVMAVINADIAVKTEAGVIKNIEIISSDGLVIGRRLNVDPENFDLELLVGGIDFFMFNLSLVSEEIYSFFSEMDISIGEPWWDFILAILFIVMSRRTFSIKNEVSFYHLGHIQQWSDSKNKENSIKFYNLIKKGYPLHEINLLMSQESEIFDVFCNNYIDKKFEDMQINKFKNKLNHFSVVIKNNYDYAYAQKNNQIKSLQRQITYLRKKAFLYFYIKIVFYKILLYLTRKNLYNFKIKNAQKNL